MDWDSGKVMILRGCGNKGSELPGTRGSSEVSDSRKFDHRRLVKARPASYPIRSSSLRSSSIIRETKASFDSGVDLLKRNYNPLHDLHLPLRRFEPLRRSLSDKRSRTRRSTMRSGNEGIESWLRECARSSPVQGR